MKRICCASRLLVANIGDALRVFRVISSCGKRALCCITAVAVSKVDCAPREPRGAAVAEIAQLRWHKTAAAQPD